MKKIISITLSLALSLGLMVACQKSEDQSTKSANEKSSENVKDSSDSAELNTSDSDKKLEKLTFVLDWTPNTNHTGIYVAQKLGYYAEAGIELSIQNPPEDGAEALVATGKADFGVSFQDTIAPAFARSEPLPITAVAAIIQHNSTGLISAKDKGIVSPKDLEGKKYATWQLPTEQAIIKNVMETAGGDYSKLELVPSTVTDVLTAITTDIDTVWVFYAWDVIAAQVKNVDYNFIAFADINPVFDYYSPFIFANNTLLREKPELVKSFLAATKKGYEYAIEHPSEAADILLEAAPELDKDIVHSSQKWLAGEYVRSGETWGQFDAKRWNAFFTWMSENKLVETAIENNTGFTNDYLPEQ